MADGEPIHIATCATCGAQLNALNPQQAVEIAGAHYHATPYCQPADARSRAEALWGGLTTVQGAR
jgi:hypothetical protein